MSEFPLFTAIYRGTVQLLRYRMVRLGLLIAIELLPLAFGPLVFHLRSVSRWEEALTYCLHPWAHSQIVILAFACAALPGRWHVRIFLALLAVSWVFGAYVTGVQSCVWSMFPLERWTKGLAEELLWSFAISALVASLLVSICKLELRWEPNLPRSIAPRDWQFSLGFLMTAMFVAGLTLLTARAVFYTPTEWGMFEIVAAIRPVDALQFAVWGTIGSLALLAAVTSRRHWVWLIVLVVTGVAAHFLFAWFGIRVLGGLWMPLAMTIHPFLVSSLLPKLGVQLPRIERLDSLHRALASVR